MERSWVSNRDRATAVVAVALVHGALFAALLTLGAGRAIVEQINPLKVFDVTPDPPPPRLLDLLRQQIRFLHYSLRTEQAYVHWVRAYIRFHGLKPPAELGASGLAVEEFLTWLAQERGVAPATHKQALSALLFLYQKVLRQDLPWMAEIGRPRSERRQIGRAHV